MIVIYVIRCAEDEFDVSFMIKNIMSNVTLLYNIF